MVSARTSKPGLGHTTVAAPTFAGNTTPAPSPNVNARGGVPTNTSVGFGCSTWRENVSAIAAMSRWKCTQPFGLPVVPEVKAISAGSSAVVAAAGTKSGALSMRRERSSAWMMCFSDGASLRACSSSPARCASTIACVTFALSRITASSCARSIGIVPTATPPARNTPHQTGIESFVLEECTSTRLPGTRPNSFVSTCASFDASRSSAS